MRTDAGCEIAFEARDRPPEQLAAKPQEIGRIRTGLHDHIVGLAHDQQRAMRLDRAGEMDRLALAVREIRLAKGRCRVALACQGLPPFGWSVSTPVEPLSDSISRGYSPRAASLRDSTSAKPL